MRGARSESWAAPCQRGFTYVALLFIVAIAGVGLAAKGVEWHTAAQRDREKDLLFIGSEFIRAIALYYYRTPGAGKEYPRSLEDLIKDQRYPGTQRYLRRIYRDPMTGRPEWGLISSPDGRIMGVHSLSKDKPLKRGNFAEAQKDFLGKSTYGEWQFVFIPPLPIPAQAGPKQLLGK